MREQPPDIQSPCRLEDNQSRDLQNDDPWSRRMVLSLDGGGIRGLTSLYILRELMSMTRDIERKYKNTSSTASPLIRPDGRERDSGSGEFSYSEQNSVGEFLPCHYFDYIGGTSTGGLIATMLGRLQFSVDEVIIHYQNIWTTMAAELSSSDALLPFRKSKRRRGNTSGLEQALSKILQTRQLQLNNLLYRVGIQRSPTGSESSTPNLLDDTFASDAEMCRTTVLSVQIDSKLGVSRPFLFRSYPSAEHDSHVTNGSTQITARDAGIMQVCRATSAAPVYFESVKLGDGNYKYRDGSIWAPNPAEVLYKEVKSMHPDVDKPVRCLISIGCGQSKHTHSPANSALSITKNRQDPDVVLQKKCLEGELEYFRLCGPLNLSDQKIKDWKTSRNGKETFQSLKAAADNYVKNESVRKQMEQCAKLLVDRRQARATTPRWGRFALGLCYVCPKCETKSRTVHFDDADDYIDHLQWIHEGPPPDDVLYYEYKRLLEHSRISTVR